MDEKIVEYLLLVMRGRRRQILMGSAVCVVLAVLTSRFMPVEYEAETKVFLNSTSDLSSMGGMPNPFSGAMDRDAIVASQEPLLKSYPVFGAVNRRLKEAGQEPLINEHADDHSTTSQWIWRLQSVLFGQDYVQTRKEFKNNEFLQFKSRVGFVADPDSGSFIIRFESPDAKRSIAVTKALAEALIEVNMTITSEHSGRVADFLQDRIDESTAEAKASSRELAAFMKSHDFSNNPDIVAGKYRAYLDERKAATESRLEVVKAEMILEKAKSVRDSVAARLQSSASAAQAVEVDAIIKQLAAYQGMLTDRLERGNDADSKAVKKRVDELRSALAKATANGDPMPSRTALQELLAATEREIDKADLEVKLNRKRVQASEKSLEEVTQEVRRVPELESEISGLMAAHTQKAKILELLTQNYLVARTSASVANSKLYVIEEPTLNTAMKAGKLKFLLILVFASIAALIMGISAYDFFVGTIYNAGQIPKARAMTHLGAIAHLHKFKDGNLAVKCRQSESLAKVAFKLSKTAGDRRAKGRIVVVTGADAMAGKSFSSLALAIGLQSRGHSVVIVDCDQRAGERSVLQYGRRSAPIVETSSDPDELVRGFAKAKDVGRVYLTSLKHDVDELVAQRHSFQQIVEQTKARLCSHFDYVILDGPPLIFTESMSLLEHADDIIVCIPEGRITRSHLADSLETIELHRHTNARVCTVLTNVKASQAAIDAYSNYQYRMKAAS